MHEYHCIVIYMRCWLMDNWFFSNAVLIVHIRVSCNSHTSYTWYMKWIFTNTKVTLKKTKLHAIEYLQHISIYSLICPPIETFIRSTHPTACRSIWFVSISYIRAAQGLPFIIASIGLASPLIHLTSVICLCL